MTKSDLIEQLAASRMHMPAKDVEAAIKEILSRWHRPCKTATGLKSEDLAVSRCTIVRPRGRNPKTGDKVELTGKYVPHFKPGKELRERVNIIE